MNDNNISIGEPTAPRYEFRTFGRDFKLQLELMEQFTQPVPEDLQIRVFNEVYIVSKNTDEVNIKVKNSLLDIKKLISTNNNLEQWDSVAKYEFPLDQETLLNEILPLLKADIPILEHNEFGVKEFLSIAKRHKDLIPITVQKKRNAYIVNYTICEFAEVIIGNDYLYTIAVESVDRDEVINTAEQLGMNSFKNINYVQAIKRVTGLTSDAFTN